MGFGVEKILGAGIRRIFVAVLFFASLAHAQSLPLQISTAAQILGPDGSPLAGNDPALAAELGLSTSPGCLVQILSAPGGIYPPMPDGTPHVSNTLLCVTRIGHGVVPVPAMAGKFAATINLASSTPVFVRVFSGPSLAQSSAYGDSQVFSGGAPDIFWASVHVVDQQVALDSDGDGLTDPWEQHLGSNAQDGDSDHDGVSDGDEYRAKTGLTDADSYLGLAGMSMAGGGNLMVSWDSVPGVSYQLEYRGELTGAAAYQSVGGLVVATGALASVVVSAPPDQGHYRVRLVE